MVFRSSLLFHGVTKWKPRGGISESGIFPGRRAHVLFTKAKPFTHLHTKRPGWFRDTIDDLMPDPGPRKKDDDDGDPLKYDDRRKLANMARLWKKDERWRRDEAWNAVIDIKLC